MNRRIAFLIVAECLTAQACAGAVVRQPADLMSGDQYRLIFVTSTTRDATSSDIEDYNQFVQNVADAAPVVGTWGLQWKALASTSDVDARANTGTDPELDPLLPIYNVNGGVFVEAGMPIFGGPPHNHPVEFTELGTLPSRFGEGFGGAAVWTGTRSNGFVNQQLGPLGGNVRGIVGIGDSGGGSFGAYINGDLRATEQAHLYALSNVITAVPEPSIYVLTMPAVLALLGLRRRVTLRIPGLQNPVNTRREFPLLAISDVHSRSRASRSPPQSHLVSQPVEIFTVAEIRRGWS